VIELELLDHAATGPGPAVVILTGPGGVGKTALARQWAYRATGRFGDGQFYVDLGGFGVAPPVDPAEALRWFLGALGVPPADLPIDLAELTALYRSYTAGLSLLVVLDNAFSVAQVRLLVPASPSSMTVVTSRRRLSGLIADGATLAEIMPLDPDDSMALLTNAVGRSRIENERDQAALLTELCAGLPIALSLAAARLSARPRLAVARLVAALTSETGRLARLETPDAEISVRGTFELSYRALDASAADLYRWLSLHPGREFGRGPVAVLAGPADTDRLIDSLLEANLLQEVAGERFQLHDLIRLHARERAESDDTEAVRDAALLGLAEWYLGAAGVADLVVTPYRRRLAYVFRTNPPELPEFADRGAALDWLERERVNLRLAGQAALDRGWAELAWQLCDVLWPLQLHRKSGDRREIDARGVAAAELWGDLRGLGRMLKRLGRTCTTLGEHDLAERYLRTAVARYAEAGDVAGGVEAREMLALAHRDAGSVLVAVDMLREVLATWRRLDDRRHAGLTLIELGTLASRLGRPAEAIDHLREAQRLLAGSADADPYNPVRVTAGLAGAYLDIGDLVAAERLAAEAAEGMTALGNFLGAAEALDLCGRIAARGGDLDRSHQFVRRARELRESQAKDRIFGARGGDDGAVHDLTRAGRPSSP
jgi:tetratricopeptide (TPR) repeat protein